MRLAAVTAFVLVLSVSGAAMAQGWSEYTNREDRFSINFPGEPKIQQTTYMPFEGPAVPARVYSAESGDSRFSMTVVDFTKTMHSRRGLSPFPAAASCRARSRTPRRISANAARSPTTPMSG
jgi:hypothetical protein